MVLRRPDGLIAPTIWAEDGGLFLAGTFEPFANLLSLRAGQIWLLQRLVAVPVAALPTTWWPLALYLVACLGAALVAAVVLSERAVPLLGSLWFRVAAGALLVAVPGVWEVQGNIANLHWWATVAAMLLLAMQAPASKVGKAFELAFIAVVSLTGLGGLLLVPVAVWRLLTQRSGYLIARSAVVGIGAVTNVVLLALYSTRVGASDPLAAAPTAVQFVVKRVGGVFVVGERGLAQFWVGGTTVATVLAVAAIVLLALVAVLVLTDLRGPSWAWLATAALCIGGAVTSVRSEELPRLLEPYISGRYVLLATAAVVLIVMRALALGTRLRRGLAIAALVLMVPGTVADAYLPPMAPAVSRDALAEFSRCLDEQPPYEDDPFCFVRIEPTSGEWKIVVWRPGVPRVVPQQ